MPEARAGEPPEPSGLLERIAAGDQDAFAALFDAHVDAVYRLALGRTGRAQDAQDVTSVVFLTAWRRRAELTRLHSSVLAWLLVCVNRCCQDVGRTRRRDAALIRRLGAARSTEHLVGTDTGGSASRLDLDNAVAGLRSIDRQVIELFLYLDMSYAEIANSLGVPIGTVRSRLARARERLRADLGRDVLPAEAACLHPERKLT